MSERERCIKILVKRAKRYHRNSRLAPAQRASMYTAYVALMYAAREIKNVRDS